MVGPIKIWARRFLVVSNPVPDWMWEDLLTWTWKRVRESSSMSTLKILEISTKELREGKMSWKNYDKEDMFKMSTLTPSSLPLAAPLLGVVGGLLLRAPSPAPSPTCQVSWSKLKFWHGSSIDRIPSIVVPYHHSYLALDPLLKMLKSFGTLVNFCLGTILLDLVQFWTSASP